MGYTNEENEEWDIIMGHTKEEREKARLLAMVKRIDSAVVAQNGPHRDKGRATLDARAHLELETCYQTKYGDLALVNDVFNAATQIPTRLTICAGVSNAISQLAGYKERKDYEGIFSIHEALSFKALRLASAEGLSRHAHDLMQDTLVYPPQAGSLAKLFNLVDAINTREAATIKKKGSLGLAGPMLELITPTLNLLLATSPLPNERALIGSCKQKLACW